MSTTLPQNLSSGLMTLLQESLQTEQGRPFHGRDSSNPCFAEIPEELESDFLRYAEGCLRHPSTKHRSLGWMRHSFWREAVSRLPRR
jgi:hypothetical protein